jgi:hypothetical protein
VEAVSRPFRLTKEYRRDEDPAAIVEEAWLNDKIADDPAFVVEKKVDDGAEVAVGRGYRVALKIPEASQHRSVLL